MSRARLLLRALIGGPGTLRRNIALSIILGMGLSVLVAAAASWWIVREHIVEFRYETLEAQARERAGESNEGRMVAGGQAVAAARDQDGVPPLPPAASRVIDFALYAADGTPLLGAVAPLPPARHIYGAHADSHWFVTPDGRFGAAVPVRVGESLRLLAAIEGDRHPYTATASLWRELLGHSYPLFLLSLLLILMSAAYAAQRTLRPLQRVLAQLSEIGPAAGSTRVSPEGAPGELRPLIMAINRLVARLIEAYRAQRDFAGNVAHEIRTPIAVLKTRLQRDGGAVPVADLMPDLERLERITRQLLDLSRVEMPGAPDFADVDLTALADDLARELALPALDRGVRLARTGGGRVRIRGNAGFLRIALRNLVENAILHSPPGSELCVEVSADPPGWRVIDAGPGVPEAQRQRIFERFARTDDPAGNRPGAGLGLSIVREVARIHDGRITVADAPGGGAIFSLIFP
ncbi:MAG: hypothetical protein Kow0058_15040 [Roseovarius sp.]